MTTQEAIDIIECPFGEKYPLVRMDGTRRVRAMVEAIGLEDGLAEAISRTLAVHDEDGHYALIAELQGDAYEGPAEFCRCTVVIVLRYSWVQKFPRSALVHESSGVFIFHTPENDAGALEHAEAIGAELEQGIVRQKEEA